MNYCEVCEPASFKSKRLEIRLMDAKEKSAIPNRIAEMGNTDVKNK